MHLKCPMKKSNFNFNSTRKHTSAFSNSLYGIPRKGSAKRKFEDNNSPLSLNHQRFNETLDIAVTREISRPKKNEQIKLQIKSTDSPVFGLQQQTRA